MLGGMESQWVSRVRQTVLARMMESQIQHLPACFVEERVQKRDNGLYMPLCLGET